MTSQIRRNPILRAVALVALAFGLIAAVPATAGAQEACVLTDDYGATMQLTANPSEVNPGDTVVISGSGFPGDCILGISVGSCAASDAIGEVVTDVDGNFSIDWTVPADQDPGEVLICTTVGSVEVTAEVTVASLKPQPPTDGGAGAGAGGVAAHPDTGAEVMPFIAGGVALLVIGSLLVLSSRKRNATH